jgi:hypothetical protein
MCPERPVIANVSESSLKVMCASEGLTVVSVTPLAVKVTLKPGARSSSRVVLPF